MGMMLKLSKQPRSLVRGFYERCEREFQALDTGLEASIGAMTLHDGATSATTQPTVNRLLASSAWWRGGSTTLYVPVKLKGVQHYALLDCGAEISVVGRQMAEFADIISPSESNVKPAKFKIRGINGASSPSALI